MQRAGVIHLLREAFDAIEAVDGEDGEVVEITDTFIGVHPEGALLKAFVDAPSLEDAEAAVEAVAGEIVEGCEPLAGWSIGKCEPATAARRLARKAEYRIRSSPLGPFSDRSNHTWDICRHSVRAWAVPAPPSTPVRVMLRPHAGEEDGTEPCADGGALLQLLLSCTAGAGS
ncbi:hypothetical protein [Kitasatospora sp. NPDC001527]|uniref:hypothetical protein n=1 Tax=Kitasatospora sp. NPDC001527 TaxID=3154519 RepID=UPI00332F2E39